MALDGLPSKESGVETSSAVSKARQLFEARLTSLSQDLARARSATERLPSEDDYHFYKLFPEFKRPIDAAAERIKKLLLQFGSVEEWSDEPDEAADWLVGIVDDLLEQVGVLHLFTALHSHCLRNRFLASESSYLAVLPRPSPLFNNVT
jgi:hypothetical protein